VDAGYRAGNVVTPSYDSLLAKLIVSADSRAGALELARSALAGFVIDGPRTTLDFHRDLVESAEFISGDYDTHIVGRLRKGVR